MERSYTNFLASDDSFMTGVGILFNISGNFYNYNRSKSGSIADSRAIRQDFAMIGQDIYDVAASVNAGQNSQLKLDL